MKKHLPFLLILALGVGLRIWWAVYTSYTAEDSFITFQFARQVSVQNEFSYNTGMPIYGSTTPLLTTLLSLWYEFNSDIALGAKVIGIIAFGFGLAFLYFSLDGPARWIAPLLVATSFRLIAEDMGGMEMSLLFLFAMGALRGLAIKDSLLSGLMCAFLLWTRMDSVVFVVVMAIAHIFYRRPILPFLVGTLAYVPWLAFAWYYFGSPIPFTLTAKAVAYGVNSAPYLVHLDRVFANVSIPVSFATLVALFFTRKGTAFLSLFILLQTAFLVFSGSTFFPRYFYLLTVVSLIVIALAIASIRDYRLISITSLLFVAITTDRSAQINSYKSMQENRHAILQRIGVWIHANTPEDSTVQLEPLGYVGYNSQRVMIDEVGLISPEVVELHRQDIGAHEFFRYLRTDYILLQCHQADGVLDEFAKEYKGIQMFTDGSFRGCYELWEKR